MNVDKEFKRVTEKYLDWQFKEYLDDITFLSKINLGESSNGRTVDFDSTNRSSILCSPTKGD